MDLDGIGDLFEGIGSLFGGASSRGGVSSNGRKPSCRHCGKVAFLVIAGIIGGVVYMMPKWETEAAISDTEEIVATAARTACAAEDDVYDKVADAWDTTLQYTKTEIEEPVIATVCTVVSAGPDGKFETGDDISIEARNLHKAKMAGKWTKQKLKEFAEGAMGNWE